MIYEEPQYKPGGDRSVNVELGDEMSFDLNFLVHTLAGHIRAGEVDGVIELIPEMASMLVSYDPDVISYEDLTKEITALYASLGDLEGIELDSRIYYVPALYFDPWTAECVEDYCARITDKERDPEFVMRLNNLEDRAEFKRVHSGTDYWVAALGFWPGLCSLMPLDPRHYLVVPKYNPPRTWTPKGTIGIGGAVTCIYPDCTPGGYQIFARTPMPTWDSQQRLPAFKDSLALFKPGDRVRFVPIEREEYDYIASQVEAGAYEHSYVDYQKFSIRNYHAWVESLPRKDKQKAA